MAIKESNSRIIVTIPNELKSKLEQEAKDEMRTLSKQVEYILKNRYEKEQKK